MFLTPVDVQLWPQRGEEPRGLLTDAQLTRAEGCEVACVLGSVYRSASPKPLHLQGDDFCSGEDPWGSAPAAPQPDPSPDKSSGVREGPGASAAACRWGAGSPAPRPPAGSPGFPGGQGVHADLLRQGLFSNDKRTQNWSSLTLNSTFLKTRVMFLLLGALLHTNWGGSQALDEKLASPCMWDLHTWVLGPTHRHRDLAPRRGS